MKSLGCSDEDIAVYHKLSKQLSANEKTLEECFELFKIAQKATSNPNSLYFATKSVIQEFSEDNVIYLELRTTPREETLLTKANYIETVVKAVRDRDQNKINVKLILSIDRRHDLKTSNETMNLIIDMKNKYPDIIKGVDFSGNPRLGDFNDQLFRKAVENGLFTTIHCAEIKNDCEVERILKFNPDRIGHGTFLHPNYGGCENNWKLYCQKKIPLGIAIFSFF